MTATRTAARTAARDRPPPRQEFEIASLAEGVRAVLIGHGWECLGLWQWRAGRARKYRTYIDLSRPQPMRIPSHQAPTHWSPVAPIDIDALGDVETAKRYVNISARPSPAHVVLAEDEGGAADSGWPYSYAPAGCITRAEVEHRVLRAIKTNRSPGVVRSVETGYKSNWPVAQMVAGWGDYAPPITVRNFNPTRRDLDDWWIALGWFARLYLPKDRPRTWTPGDWSMSQRIVAWRASDPTYSWRQIGDRVNRSNEWSRRHYQAAIDTMWHIANEG